MKTRYTVALSMIAGAALGATAIQGLHAQAKKAYLISLSDIADRTAIEAYNTKVREELTKAGGNVIILGGDRIIALTGTAPQRIGLLFVSLACDFWFISCRAANPRRFGTTRRQSR